MGDAGKNPPRAQPPTAADPLKKHLRQGRAKAHFGAFAVRPVLAHDTLRGKPPHTHTLMPITPSAPIAPRRILLPLAIAVALKLGGAAATAQPIAVPNASFESQVAPPSFPYVTTQVDSWQKAPKPAWFDEGQVGVFWDQTAGLFQNTPVGAPNHIPNMDGNQGLYLLAFPQVGIFQDYNSTAWNQPAPSHAFNEHFEVGQSYELTVGVIGGLGGMAPGTMLQLGLYYRDAADNLVPAASTVITHDPTLFTDPNRFLDFTVTLPPVAAGDPWAGQNLGIQISTLSGTGQGYWDLDNVRLTAVPEPAGAQLALLALALGGAVVARIRRQRRDR
jgi:hypothetical protein